MNYPYYISLIFIIYFSPFFPFLPLSIPLKQRGEWDHEMVWMYSLLSEMLTHRDCPLKLFSNQKHQRWQIKRQRTSTLITILAIWLSRTIFPELRGDDMLTVKGEIREYSRRDKSPQFISAQSESWLCVMTSLPSHNEWAAGVCQQRNVK